LNELFVESRNAKGLTVEAAASRLNMTVKQLEKLESDQLNPTNLTTFERGYVRNYAALLELESEVFDIYFPESNSISSELHSFQRYSQREQTPLLGGPFLKGFFTLLILAIVVALVWVNIPTSAEKGALSGSEKPAKISLKAE